jgi:hypothetical protein
MYNTGYQGYFNPDLSVEIEEGQTESAIIDCSGFVLCGVMLPAAFTGTVLTFLASTTESGPFQPVYNSSGQVSYAVAQGEYIAIDPKDFHGVAFLQIVSGSSEAALRTLTCSLKGF